MDRRYEKPVEVYCKKYKNGLFGKQYSINLFVYSSCIEGDAFEFYGEEISSDTFSFEIPYENIKSIYIEYRTNSVVRAGVAYIVLMGIDEPQKWLNIIETERKKYIDKLNRKKVFGN